jgi:hypothetical protein
MSVGKSYLAILPVLVCVVLSPQSESFQSCARRMLRQRSKAYKGIAPF